MRDARTSVRRVVLCIEYSGVFSLPGPAIQDLPQDMQRFPRLSSFPQEPLARFRLLSACLAVSVALLNAILVASRVEFSGVFRVEAVAASLLLGLWWAVGYKRGGFPLLGWLVDGVLLTVIGAQTATPPGAIGLFFMGMQFRALYVSRREFLLLPLTYGLSRLLSGAMVPGTFTLESIATPAILQAVGLGVIAFTLHLLVNAAERQRDIERALAHSDMRYQSLASAMRDVVYDWDVSKDTVEWTESMQSVFGFPRPSPDPDWAWWIERVHPDDREHLINTAKSMLRDPSCHMEMIRYRVRRDDGSHAHVSASMIIQRRPDGEPERVIGSVRDVSTEQVLEEQLRQSQKMEAVGQLAGGVAHDFNNLLTVIGGHVFMLDHAMPQTPDTRKHLNGITRAADRAALLTRQLLAFSRKQLLAASVTSLNDIVDDVLQMIRPVIGEQIQIVTKLDPSLSPVFADPGQLGQVLVNLALNARDAMPNGGTLTIETSNASFMAGSVELAGAALAAGDYVRLVMRDTGVGMDAQTLARAFEPFYTTKTHGQGSGLGLATVYGIVRQSFGDIQAASTLGEGSAFTIFLPVATGVATVEAPRPAATREAEDPLAPRRILLVEDDDGVREFAHEVLSRAGYQVQSARNGADAIQQVDAADSLESFDVVVTDVVMPEMGGRELVEHLRRRRPGLPAVYITGYTDDSRMIGALYAPDTRLLEKPFTASALGGAVEEVSEAAARSTAA